MAAINNIRALAQRHYFTVNGSINDDTGADLEEFEDNFIMAFNLWRDEFETEAYWNKARVNDFELATITDTTTYSFELPEEYRTPVFDKNKELKFVNDGIVIARFTLVNPDQRQVDDDISRPNRATFVDENRIVLSRAPKEEELGATIVLDVVRHIPDLTRTDDTALSYIPGKTKQVAVLGIAKNTTLADVTKVALSPSFAQKYSNELNKAIGINDVSNEIDEMTIDIGNTNFGVF